MINYSINSFMPTNGKDRNQLNGRSYSLDSKRWKSAERALRENAHSNNTCEEQSGSDIWLSYIKFRYIKCRCGANRSAENAQLINIIFNVNIIMMILQYSYDNGYRPPPRQNCFNVKTEWQMHCVFKSKRHTAM